MSSSTFRLLTPRIATIPRAIQKSTPQLRARFHQSSKRCASEMGPRPNPGQSPFKVWPFIAIVLAGSGAYVAMVRSRVDQPAYEKPTNQGLLPATPKATPTFSSKDTTVIFVLGGPGAGKGTQCANLVRDYHFTHLSAGDLLRAEQDRPDSEFGQLIKDYIKEGKIVPMEVTVHLLENAMTERIRALKKSAPGTKAKFLIDGFPRKMDQAVRFEETVCVAKAVLFFDCPEEEMQKRLLKRGETSGRADDNLESITKRFRTFVDTSMPVVNDFETKGKVVRVLATRSPEEVYKETRTKLVAKLGADLL